MQPDPLEALDDRSRALPRAVKIRVGVGAAAVLLIAAFAVAVAVGAFARGGSSGSLPPVSMTTAPPTPGASAGTRGAGEPAATLYVHILGAVERPGLYALATGSRVVDAVGAAGGVTDDADPAGVNLARPLSDGEQLVVPHRGETVPEASPVSGAAGTSTAPGGKINLNTATEEQLEQLPRVGPAMAQKILQWRELNGRFTSVEDLMNVSGIGQKTFDGLKDSVTV